MKNKDRKQTRQTSQIIKLRELYTVIGASSVAILNGVAPPTPEPLLKPVFRAARLERQLDREITIMVTDDIVKFHHKELL